MADSDPREDALPSSSPSETSPAEDTAPSPSSPSSAHEPSPASPSSEAAPSESAPDNESTTLAASNSSSTEPPPPTLEQARVFLRDDAVRRETRPRKAAFLAGKGLTSQQIDQLLAEEDDRDTAEAAAAAAAAAHERSAIPEQAPSLPPIVTYPEFLARPQQPPPLVTPGVFLGALYGGAAASSLLYAAARLVLAPMADALTESRADLHGAAAANLDRLLGRLEAVVSEVPAAAQAGAGGAAARSSLAAAAAAAAEAENDDEDVSTAGTTDSYDDPTEVFHRDIGVQTSLPPSPALAPQAGAAVSVTMDSTVPSASAPPPLPPLSPPSASALQAERLASLVESVRGLGQGWAAPADVLAEIQTTVGVFREDVDKLSRPPAYAYGGGGGGGAYGTGMYSYGSSVSTSGSSSSSKYPGYVTTTRNEPDDEIRKAKENIRRVKGALLTTRTFPTAR